MGFYGEGGDHRLVYHILVWAMNLIGAACSSLLLYLLRVEAKNSENCHNFLIKHMSRGQLAYDLSFPVSGIYYGNTVFIIFNIFQIIGGLSVAIISNIMTIVVYYVIKERRYIDILSHKGKLYAIVFAPVVLMLVFFLLAMLGDDRLDWLLGLQQSIYFWCRLASIVINFIVCSLAFVFVVQLNRKALIDQSRKAVYTVVTRLLWYPIVQSISRSGLTVYELVYGWDFDPDVVTKAQFAWQLFYTIITPMASIGYLAIYLVMQPKAWTQVVNRFGYSTDVLSSSVSESGGHIPELFHTSISSKSIFETSHSDLHVSEIETPCDSLHSTLNVTSIDDLSDDELRGLIRVTTFK
jgi:hypothetical protein